MHPALEASTRHRGARLTGVDASAAREHAGELARLAASGKSHDAALARYVLRLAAVELGALPASIAPLYAARGRGEVAAFTVPAINVRGLTFETSRALLRAMRANDTKAAVFELNRAEVEFTAQRPAEFSAVVLAAALAEHWVGPVFFQADHLQANLAAFRSHPDNESHALESLVAEFVAAGFYNIDIDASTLVDISQPTVTAQQAPNVALTARLAHHARALQPSGVEISIGGEIGEVGGHNSTEEELAAYVDGVIATVDGLQPLSKVSVQTGTTHGGVLLPDGSRAEVALEFGVLERLSRLARETYGMAGAVQHGASTLPVDLFARFPQVETAEVHLATGFQDIVFDHPALPATLREAIAQTTLSQFAAERRDGETDAQFIRRLRRKAWGPLKQEFCGLPENVTAEIAASLETRFAVTLQRLGVAGLGEIVDNYVRPVAVEVAPPAA